MNWIKKAGLKALKERSKQEQMNIVEMDELYTYIKKRAKNTNLEGSRYEKDSYYCV